jgi:RNA polymerase sigma-70 factor (ECF subfamily)
MKASDKLASVIEGAQRREPEAFETLVGLYASRLYGFLYRFTGCQDDAQDLVQEVFVRLVRTIDQYEHEDRFEAWLFRIAANLARDRVRRLGRAPGTISLDEVNRLDAGNQGRAEQSGIANRDRPDREMELAEDVDRLQRALDDLPETEREVVMLRHYSDLSFAEIAELMGTPLGTALARAHRGLRKLRAIMGDM